MTVYTIEINDHNSGSDDFIKRLLSLVKKKKFVTIEKVETPDCDELLERMEKNREGKDVSRSQVMKLIEDKLS